MTCSYFQSGTQQSGYDLIFSGFSNGSGMTADQINGQYGVGNYPVGSCGYQWTGMASAYSSGDTSVFITISFSMNYVVAEMTLHNVVDDDTYVSWQSRITTPINGATLSMDLDFQGWNNSSGVGNGVMGSDIPSCHIYIPLSSTITGIGGGVGAGSPSINYAYAYMGKGGGVASGLAQYSPNFPYKGFGGGVGSGSALSGSILPYHGLGGGVASGCATRNKVYTRQRVITIPYGASAPLDRYWLMVSLELDTNDGTDFIFTDGVTRLPTRIRYQDAETLRAVIRTPLTGDDQNIYAYSGVSS